MAEEKYMTIKMSSVWNILTVVTFVLVLTNVYLTYNLSSVISQGTGSGAVLPGTQPNIQPTPTAPSAPSLIPSAPSGGPTMNAALFDDDVTLGSDDAPIVLVEFSDFQCPFCRVFWKNTLPSIKSEYIDTGKVQFVYRDFPLNFHPAAQKAAESAECARDQGKWEEMHDKIFIEQDKQGQGTIQFTVDDMKKWAGEIGLDTATFNTCLDSNKYQQEVEADLQAGSAAGIRGTPGFVVGKRGEAGQLISGAQPFSSFKTIFDRLASQ